MTSYDEHLISMAGGDGDDIEDVLRRRGDTDCTTHKTCLRADIGSLVATVREQKAQIELIANQASAAEMLCRMNGGDQELAVVPAGAIRAALEPTP